MRRILLSLLLFCGDVGPVLALSAEDLPGSFSIKEQKCNTDTCFDLTTNGQTIGSLRRTPGTLGTFDFFDQQHQRQVILKFTKTFWGSPQFEVYDKNQVLIGQLQLTFDRKIGRVIRFDLSSANGKVLFITGSSNLFGTKHTVYVGKSWEVMATLTRPLFTWSRDSDVTIINKDQFLNRVDPNVLAAVMALYCLHDTTIKVDNAESIAPPKLFQDLQAKLKKLAEDRAGDAAGIVVTEAQKQAAADLLNQRYREIYDDSNLNEEEKIKQFVAFGCGLIQSRTLSPVEEQAMLQFLISRLG
ncbi:MAG: hypothetical protein NTU48_06175 [Legionellales bacterium]|nr:hypothetical protein [Legionellales bacterium]